jgi:hypothetical protein
MITDVRWQDYIRDGFLRLGRVAEPAQLRVPRAHNAALQAAVADATTYARSLEAELAKPPEAEAASRPRWHW